MLGVVKLLENNDYDLLKVRANIEVETQKWSYEEICNMKFRTIFNADCYTYDEKNQVYTDLRETSAGLKYLYDNGVDLTANLGVKNGSATFKNVKIDIMRETARGEK